MRIAIALYSLALGIRLVLVALFPDPAYPDSAYYIEVARAIAAGRGPTVDFVWIFAEVGGKIPASPLLPIPSNGHWMPLASFIQVPSILLFGPTALASDLPFALLGSLGAPLTWAIARDAGANRAVAVGSGVLGAVPLLATVFMAQADNFALYPPIVGGALWVTSRALRGDQRAFVVAGFLAGLAMLARVDGSLVLAVLVLAVLHDRISHGAAARIRIATILGAGATCLAVVGPWAIRQLAVFGTLSPSAASGRSLYMRSYAEWNSITGTPDLAYLLGQGAGPLLISRLTGLAQAASIFAVIVCGLVLLPFVAVGLVRRARSVEVGPAVAFGCLLFLFAGTVAAIHVPGGMFAHSAVGLLPYVLFLALDGVAAVAAWGAARGKGSVAHGTPILVGGVVAISIAVGIAYVPLVHGTWDEARREKRAVAAALDRVGAGPGERLMTIDAASYRYYTGRGGVVIVNDPLPTIRKVAVGYGVRWLVIERRDGVPALSPILDGAVRPDWIGEPVFSLNIDGDAGADLMLLPVCFTDGDRRCARLAASRVQAR